MVEQIPESIKETSSVEEVSPVETVPSVKPPVKKINFKRLGIILSVLVILISIPIAVSLTKQRQEIRKMAIISPPELTFELGRTLYLPMYSKKWHDLWGSTMIQNIGETTTDITLRAHNEYGDQVFTETKENIPAKGFTVFYAPTIDGLDDDFLGTAIITSSNSEIAAIVTHGRAQTSEYAESIYAGYSAYNALTRGARTLYLPMYSKNYHDLIGSTMIQNIGEEETTINIFFYENDGSMVHTLQETIPAKGFRVFFSEDDVSSLSDDFLGTVVVNSSDTEIAAMVTHGRSQTSEYSNIYVGYNAYDVPLSGAQTLYLPMYSRDYHDLIGSTTVQNTGETTTDITIGVYDVDGNQVFTEIQENIPPKGLTVFYAPALLDSLGGDEFLGTAIITSSNSEIAAIVTHGRAQTSEYAESIYAGYSVYKALEGGGKTVYLPMYIKNWHGLVGSTMIQNIGEEETTVAVSFYDVDGNETASTDVTIPAKGFRVLFSEQDVPLGDEFLGTAILTSNNSDITALLTHGRSVTAEYAHIYTGYSAYTGFLPVPTPTPTPTSTPTSTPTPTPTPILVCQNLKAYNNEWEEIVDLNSISIGDTVYFLVEGFSDDESQGVAKARFRINEGVSEDWCQGVGNSIEDDWCETTNTQIIGDNEYYYSAYEVSSAGTYTVEAMVYNPEVGWR